MHGSVTLNHPYCPPPSPVGWRCQPELETVWTVPGCPRGRGWRCGWRRTWRSHKCRGFYWCRSGRSSCGSLSLAWTSAATSAPASRCGTAAGLVSNRCFQLFTAPFRDSELQKQNVGFLFELQKTCWGLSSPADLGSSILLRIWEVRLWMRA